MITARSIYAADTLLFSNITVSQTGPMQLTVSGGEFQTTGWSSIVPAKDIPDRFIADGKAELTLDGRGRIWHQDKRTGRILNRSYRRTLVSPQVVDVVSHPSKDKVYRLDLEAPNDTTFVLTVTSWFFDDERMPARNVNYTHHIVFPFVVPKGTTDLSGLNIQVMTVLPGFPPKQPAWEV